MLRVATSLLVRARTATGVVKPRALVLVMSTTVRGGGPERPPNDLPPASTVTGPGPDTINRVPPQVRLTGDEVEEALDPLGRVGRAVEESVKSTVGTAAEVMSGKREDPIVNVAEEAFDSVPKFQRAREMQAARGKEKLAGSKYPDNERTMDPVGEIASQREKVGDDAVSEQHSSLVDKVQEGMETVAEKLASAVVGDNKPGAAGEIVEKVVHGVEHGAHVLKDSVTGVASKVGQAVAAAAAQQGGVGGKAGSIVEGVKETVAGMAERVAKAGAAHEEGMQAAAEQERKQRVHGEDGAAEVEAVAREAGADAHVKDKDTGGGRRGKGSDPSENILGAPPGPKSEKEAGNQPWGSGNW